MPTPDIDRVNLALHEALGPYDARLERTLDALNAGADPNAHRPPSGPNDTTRRKWTPLFALLTTPGVVSGKDVEPCLRALLDHGADPNLAVRGDSPLTIASSHGHPTAIAALVQAGASLEFKDASGSTALHNAARHGEFECVQELLLAGADPLALDANGSTPLVRACENVGARNAKAAALLLNASPEALEIGGDNALALAQAAWNRDGHALTLSEMSSWAVAQTTGYPLDFESNRTPLPTLQAAFEAREIAKAAGLSSPSRAPKNL